MHDSIIEAPSLGVPRTLRMVLVTFALSAMPASATADDDRALSVRGVVRAEAAATISTDLVARITTLPFKTGQSFRAGDILVAFDCRRYEADLRAAEAEAALHAITVDTNKQLLKHRAAGTNDLAQSEARHAQAVATAESLRIKTAQCTITAPYDGRVVERLADGFELPQAGAPLIRIVKDGGLEIDLIVPSRWVMWLLPGHAFRFTVDETGDAHTARLLHLGAVVDPVSRTMKVTSALSAPSPLVRPGMSGTAALIAPSREAR